MSYSYFSTQFSLQPAKTSVLEFSVIASYPNECMKQVPWNTMQLHAVCVLTISNQFQNDIRLTNTTMMTTITDLLCPNSSKTQTSQYQIRSGDQSFTASLSVSLLLCPLLTSLAVQFYLGSCSKSGMETARLAICQCL